MWTLPEGTIGRRSLGQISIEQLVDAIMGLITWGTEKVAIFQC
jgi:hypothetical protein